MHGAECDSYFNIAAAFAQRVMPPVESWLAQNWAGRHEVAHGENEFAEPTMEDTTADPPDRLNPRGKITGTGEHIEIAINGSYVNGLGQTVDNGNANFDYVVVIPILWDAENVDTLTDFREGTLGNHELQSAGGGKAWIRQEHDSDGSPYRIGEDFDSEFFTLKVMDASGWESTPIRTGLRKPKPVKKGSAEKPTTVILTGALLSQGNGPIRSNFIAASASSILEAISDPGIGGYHDEICEMQALGMVTGFTARPLFSSVCLAWFAVGESQASDFTLQRASAEAGPYEKLDSSGIVTGKKRESYTEYRYIDREPEKGTAWYYRLERSLDGADAFYGPVSVRP
jgi:hypothetical protein